MDKCDDKMEMVLKAAHDVDVGDYYFDEKNYNGALMRYNDALEEKPEDSAIHVRLGRVYEKLNQVPQAIEQYKAAQTLAGPEKWSDEAKAALQRLQSSTSNRNRKGKVVLLEFVVPPGNEAHPSKVIDIEMLFFPGGRERMQQEWRQLFAAGGFRLTRIVPTKSPLSVIEAEPA